jgi:extracellular elastinolytic metalloproteinase
MLKYLIVDNKLRPVYDMIADVADADNWLNVQMDINSGSILQLVDWISEAKYNVFPIGVNDPEDGDRVLVNNPEDKLASPLGWHDSGAAQRRGEPNGQSKQTLGNNVFAQSNPGTVQV